jgi:oligopeptide/dipeptide ABC transporter ATP-binding protein
MVKALQVTYRARKGSVYAVTDAEFLVERGELVAIIGETGSGKSSVIRALLGLLPVTARVTAARSTLETEGGCTELVDANERELRKLRGTSIGFVPQGTSGALNPVLTIWQHFDSIYRAHRLRGSRRALRERVEQLLEGIGFRDPHRVLGQYPHQLSGGMVQRAVLGLAIAMDPMLLVADEPTSGLDASVKNRVMCELRQQATHASRALLMVTHDVSVVAEYCDRIVVMYGGCVVETGPTLEILRHPRHPYTSALIAAVPRPGREPASLPGSARVFTEPLVRCAFYDRCPRSIDERCAQRRPELQEVVNGHRVATFCD